MAIRLTLAFVFSALAATISGGTALLLVRRWSSAGVPALVSFNLAVMAWTGGNALQLQAATLGRKLLWINVQYVGIAVLPVATFAFATSVAGHDRWRTPHRLITLLAPLLGLVVLSWTNGYHGLVRESVTLVTAGNAQVIRRTFGPAFWAGWVYSNSLNLLAMVLIVRAVTFADEVLRKRTLALFVGAIVPWIAHLLFIGDAIPVEPEPFFAVTGVAFTYATLRYETVKPSPGRDAVLEAIEEGIMVVNDDDVIVDINSSARELLDLGRSAVVGKPIETVLDGEFGLVDLYRDGEDVDGEVVASGDEDHYLDVRILTADDRFGYRECVIVLHDVTELRERQKRLRQQNERLENFANIVSHDLRNPLTVATGRVDLARREYDSEDLDAARRALERMETLVDDILALARHGRAIDDLERVTMSALAERSWDVMATKQATLDIESDGTFLADSDRFQRLLENVFRNAIEHGGEDVTIRIGTLADPPGFSVSDDGPGIPVEDRDDVFESGYTTADDGTGFGLAIVERIAAAHGWTIALDESDDGGVKFEFVGVDRPEE